MIHSPSAEWLHTDGLGGFASGTVSTIRTRRYHALLLVATRPPAGRFALVNGAEVWMETEGRRLPLSWQRYRNDVVHPAGHRCIDDFRREPWPVWTLRPEPGIEIEQALIIPPERAAVVLSWRVRSARAPVRLHVRPLLSGRDAHSLVHENPACSLAAEHGEGLIRWRLYEGLPAILARPTGTYRHEPQWYRQFEYEAERERGLDFLEDLASPGVFSFDLGDGEAVLALSADGVPGSLSAEEDQPQLLLSRARAAREASARLADPPLVRAAAAYVVRRGGGATVVAGYPWFTDWGRDTFIALRGLCLCTGHADVARRILLEWAGTVSEGMLPNLFPEQSQRPEYNSVDASLWFIIAVDALERTLGFRAPLSQADRSTLHGAVDAILSRYARGTRYRIRADDDGLLAAGEPGVQLTWMDAKVGDWVVTPRIGKPVEVQALWLNALRIAGERDAGWRAIHDRGAVSFRERFWNPRRQMLYDVVDVDHEHGRTDDTFRPNQLFAVGGLPFALIGGARARRVVDVCESELLTTFGPRSLARGEPGYVGHYDGDVRSRDGAYHQGTVWPWLMGAFIEAWVRVRDDEPEARAIARERFLAPLLSHAEFGPGLGHLPEIADGDAPFTPRGCPFQAWSVGEALRIRELLGDNELPESR